MPKLFVALDLPRSATEALIRLQPPPTPGIRPAPADQMHVTLKFIGEAPLDRVIGALETVRFPAFLLTLGGVGQFPSAGGEVTLWAGVRDPVRLTELHQTVDATLALHGFPKETRPFNAHVTLARCKPEAPAGLLQDFLTRQAAFRLEAIPVSSIVLFSSSLVEGVPVYRREKSFELGPAAT